MPRRSRRFRRSSRGHRSRQFDVGSRSGAHDGGSCRSRDQRHAGTRPRGLTTVSRLRRPRQAGRLLERRPRFGAATVTPTMVQAGGAGRHARFGKAVLDSAALPIGPTPSGRSDQGGARVRADLTSERRCRAKPGRSACSGRRTGDRRSRVRKPDLLDGSSSAIRHVKCGPAPATVPHADEYVDLPKTASRAFYAAWRGSTCLKDEDAPLGLRRGLSTDVLPTGGR